MKISNTRPPPLTARVRHGVILPAIDVFPILEAGVEEVRATAGELALQIVPQGTEPWLRDVTFNDLGCAQGEEGLLQEFSCLYHI